MNTINKPIPRGGTRREREQDPRRVIHHSMAEYIKHDGIVYYASEWLKFLGYSAHVLVSPQGNIIRCRPDHLDAIHAYGNNRDTLGIEWLVPGEYSRETYGDWLKKIHTKGWVSSRQFENGSYFVRTEWVQKRGILHHEKHCDVDPRGEKEDPGRGFPWMEMLKEIGVITF